MKLFIPVKFILQHPLTKNRRMYSIVRFLYWQVISRIRKRGIVFSWMGKAKLYVKKGMHGATGNYYAYLHDFEEMSFLLHFLDKEDIFWDIGANVGSYTILASKIVSADVLAFEPLPESYKYLIKNIHLNSVTDRVRALNIGIAESKGELNFTNNLDTINHVVKEARENSLKIPVDTCDNILENFSSPPSIIKLDVEGYEYPVLKGAYSLLGNSRLLAIIIELNGLGKKFGFDDLEIHKILSEYKFLPYTYEPFKRSLIKIEWPFQMPNVIYCRDIDKIHDKLQKGIVIQVAGFKY